MKSDILFYAVFYSVIVGLAMSLIILRWFNKLRTLYYNSVYYEDHQDRVIRQCRAVTATRTGYASFNGVSSGRNTSSMMHQTFSFMYKGRKYQYVSEDRRDLGNSVTLFFLENPKSACRREDMVPGILHWKRYVIPAGLLLAVILFQYFYPWIEYLATLG